MLSHGSRLWVLSIVLLWPAAASADALLYSDQSPGSLTHRCAWEGWAAQHCAPVVIATDVGDFECRLGERNWSAVIVVARYAASEPPYATDLRAFASSHGSTPIHLIYWHDHGQDPTADTAVTATLGIAMWYNGRTTIGYAYSPGYTSQPDTFVGFLFPTFGGIQTGELVVIAQVDPEEARGKPPASLIDIVMAIIRYADCHAECFLRYRTDIETCDANRELDTSQCEQLYGPNSGHPDPPQYLQCITEANEAHTNCISAATNRYSNCVKLCPPIEATE